MLDMGFIHDVRRVIDKTPEKKQTLLFSATMPPEIQEIADRLLHDMAVVQVAPPATTVEAIRQYVYFVDRENKRRLLAWLLENPELISVLVFTRTKHGADRVARDLTRAGFSAQSIHGDKSQNARQAALTAFKEGRCRVLVATDIAARGIDIEELSHVVNFDIPEVPETYVHRIGRTGRAGLEGTAISFCTADERADFDNILRLTKAKIKTVEDHPFPQQQTEPTPKEELQRLKEERRLAAREARLRKDERRRERAAAKEAEKSAPAPKAEAQPQQKAEKTDAPQENRQKKKKKKGAKPQDAQAKQPSQNVPQQNAPKREQKKQNPQQNSAPRREQKQHGGKQPEPAPRQYSEQMNVKPSHRHPKKYEYKDNTRLKDDIVTYTPDWGSPPSAPRFQPSSSARKKPQDQPLSDKPFKR